MAGRWVVSVEIENKVVGPSPSPCFLIRVPAFGRCIHTRVGLEDWLRTRTCTTTVEMVPTTTMKMVPSQKVKNIYEGGWY